MTERERIPMLDIDEARRRATERGVPEQMADLSVFRIALHQPGVAAALNGMLHELLWNGVLDARLRELIIMRIGWSTGSVSPSPSSRSTETKAWARCARRPERSSTTR